MLWRLLRLLRRMLWELRGLLRVLGVRRDLLHRAVYRVQRVLRVLGKLLQPVLQRVPGGVQERLLCKLLGELLQHGSGLKGRARQETM